ncbi:enoyl-CoA hydratase-related protein [Pseudooceanicola nanhaiensis]|uniref:enoyl-CoA hydratase-related protein n=1 Tax=Pseudooceanicola nanhaiensis TaxID=375761 RepID=UPI004059A395
MAGTVRMHREGPVAVLLLDHPPAQILSQRARKGLMTALDRAEADPAIRAVIIGDASGGFPGQVNPREFGAPLAAPVPAALALRIESFPKPVVALLAGNVTGAGAELALAADARVAVPAARIGFADTLIGLPPSAGRPSGCRG